MKYKLLVTSIITAFATSAYASEAIDYLNEQTEGLVTLSGFGTLGATKTNTHDAEYVTSPKQKGGATNSSWDGTLDTSLGVQAKFKPAADSPFSFTIQGLAKKREDDDFRMRTEWAYGQYDVNSNLSLRVGKLAIPIFTLSDIRNVGYAQLSVRPPIDLYGLVPITQYTGGEAIVRLSSDVGNFTLQPFIGSHKDYIPNSGLKTEFKGSQLVGMNVSYENNGFTLRGVHLKTRLTESTNPGEDDLFGLMNMLGYSDLVDRYNLDKRLVKFSGIGVGYENKHVVFQSEYARRDANGAWLGVMDGWYAQLGYKMKTLTPYIGVAGGSPKTKLESNDIPALSGYHVAAQEGLNVLFRSGAVDQKTHTVGMRYDFYDNMDVKFQFDRVHVRNQADGYFKQGTSEFNSSDRYYNMYNVVLDFTF